jgi:hypothetical protein
MKLKKVGTYNAGNIKFTVFLCPGIDGEGKIDPTIVKVHHELWLGADVDNWHEMVDTLLHEVGECLRAIFRYRYVLDSDYANLKRDCTFILNHNQYSDLCAREGMFLAECLPDLADAWKLWKKDKKK